MDDVYHVNCPAASVDYDDVYSVLEISDDITCDNSLAASVYYLNEECPTMVNEHSLAASVYGEFVECSTNINSTGSTETTVVVGSLGDRSQGSSSQSPADIRGVSHDEEVNDVIEDHLTYDCNQVHVDMSKCEDVVQNECINYVEEVEESVINPCPISLRLHKPVLVSGVQSQLNPQTWSYYLEHEDDIDLQSYLWTGVSEGFDIVNRDVDIDPYECPNYNSCITGPAFQFVDNLILNELDQGKFVLASEKPHCVHALGAVPKSDGSFRPITDCKRPLSRSINNYMDTTFSYASTDQVCDMMTQGCYMATVDIASAYRSVSVHPDQWTYQGNSWPIQGHTTYLYDVRLSFGLRCAPFIFTQLSNFVVRTMKRLGYANVISYIDDFIVVESTREKCVQSQAVLFELLGSLGFEVSWKKCTAPATMVRYLGIDFDSMEMTLSLPEDKVDKLFRVGILRRKH